MDKKKLGIVLLVVGVIVLLVALFADSLGIGSVPGFGYKQIAGAVVGAIVAGVGYFFFSKK